MRTLKRFGVLSCLLLFTATIALGQGQTTATKYWIYFKDKGANKQQDPSRFLSPRALERRAKRGISLAQNDLPVDATYCQELESVGVVIRHRSRWFNAVSAVIEPWQADQVRNLPFVKNVQPIRRYKLDLGVTSTSTHKVQTYAPGYAVGQIAQIGLDFLHNKGFNGKGILIAIMDSGFDGIDQNPGMSHLFDRGAIKVTKDFVEGDDNVYDEHNHGASVFSILAGFKENEYIGSAPGADYLLLRTEDVLSETNQEEDNWVAAAEFADSMGADIFSTSLGYSDMDSGSVSYLPSDMDGNTAIITRAADLAASKGILVVNSAGNNGNIVTAPADGDSVLAVGAVDEEGVLASFSSGGPTADNRIKPELCAVGSGTYYLRDNGDVSAGSGTSFSAPLMSGLAASLWQSAPDLTNMELMEILKKSGDRANNPDNEYGYGIPNARTAFEMTHGQAWNDQLYLNEFGVGAYPNPVTDELNLIVDYQNADGIYLVEMYDTRGGIFAEKELTFSPGTHITHWHLGEDIPYPGEALFYLRIWNADRTEVLFDRKMLYLK